MHHVSEALRDVLARSGMHDRTAGTGLVMVNKGRGAAMDGAHSQLKASNPEGGLGYSPIGRQGGTQPIGMRKSPGYAGAGSECNDLGEKPKEPSPHKRPVLTLIIGSARQKGVSTAPLYLVQT